jgi:UDP-N-acetylglucosamine--N-acetylmuramyl-(pentapeptide) pyrophosphoryl-undecaprenol N-acetylglucosamine transferase
VVPFIEKMAPCYRRADLVLCRAGAGTVAELAVCGRPAVFVPYPFSAHDHQVANARRLVDRGAARMILDGALTGETLSETLLELYRRPEERDRMAGRIREIGRPRAADEIVDHCYDLLGKTESRRN